MKKAVITILAAVTVTLSSAAALAANNMTAEDVKNKLWENTLDKQTYCDEVLNLTYIPEEDYSAEPKRLGDLIDASKSVMIDIAAPDDWHTQKQYLCGEKENPDNRYFMSLYQGADGRIYLNQLYQESQEVIDSLYENEQDYQEIADAVNRYIPEDITYIYKNLFGAEIGTGDKQYRLYMTENDVMKAEDAEGFYKISDTALLAEKNAEQRYKEESEKLEQQWFAETSDAIKARIPQLRTEDEALACEDLSEQDSLSAYAGSACRYSDIHADEAPYTNLLADKGIMEGYGDGTFGTQKTVTRAETAALMCRLFNIEPEASTVFSDVPAEHWAAGYIGAFAKLGILSGYSDGTFKPDKEISYDELFKITVLMMGIDADYYFMSTPSSYPLTTTRAALTHGYAEGIDSFDTTAAVTRINIAKIMCNLLDSHLYSHDYAIGLENPGITSMGMYDVTLSQYLAGEPLRWGQIIQTQSDAEQYLSRGDALYAQIKDIMIDLSGKMETRFFNYRNFYRADEEHLPEFSDVPEESKEIPEEPERTMYIGADKPEGGMHNAGSSSSGGVIAGSTVAE